MKRVDFDNEGNLMPQKIKYKPKRDEETEEMVDKYIKRKINFQINYDNDGNSIFVKKEKC